MRSNLLLTAVLAFSTGCASIDGHHVSTTTQLLKGVDQREEEAKAVLDTLEDTARRELDLKMFYVIGREIIKEFLKLEDEEGKTFDDDVCEAKGVGRDESLLAFAMALSDTYERRKKTEWAPIGDLIKDSRRIGRDGFNRQRQGLSALKSGLKASVKDKKWREDMLRSVGAPVDQAKRLNATSKKVDKLLREVGK